MKKIIAVLLCLFVTLSLSSCILSKNPLGDKATAIIDPNLSGIWYAKDKDNPGTESYIAISQDPDGILDAITFSNSEVITDATYRGYISKIGKDHYMNLQSVKDRAVSGDYIPVYYTIKQNGELVISFFDEKFFGKAIKNGSLKGTVKKTEGPILTDSTENIARFIGKNKKEDYLPKDETFVFKNLRKWPGSVTTNK